MPQGPNIKNYTEEQCLALCAEVRTVLPIGMNQWAKVAASYAVEAKDHGWPEHDRDSLKRKFEGLANTRKPTGTCPMPLFLLFKSFSCSLIR